MKYHRTITRPDIFLSGKIYIKNIESSFFLYENRKRYSYPDIFSPRYSPPGHLPTKKFPTRILSLIFANLTIPTGIFTTTLYIYIYVTANLRNQIFPGIPYPLRESGESLKRISSKSNLTEPNLT